MVKYLLFSMSSNALSWSSLLYCVLLIGTKHLSNNQIAVPGISVDKEFISGRITKTSQISGRIPYILTNNLIIQSLFIVIFFLNVIHFFFYLFTFRTVWVCMDSIYWLKTAKAGNRFKEISAKTRKLLYFWASIYCYHCFVRHVHAHRKGTTRLRR